MSESIDIFLEQLSSKFQKDRLNNELLFSNSDKNIRTLDPFELNKQLILQLASLPELSFEISFDSQCQETTTYRLDYNFRYDATTNLIGVSDADFINLIAENIVLEFNAKFVGKKIIFYMPVTMTGVVIDPMTFSPCIGFMSTFKIA